MAHSPQTTDAHVELEADPTASPAESETKELQEFMDGFYAFHKARGTVFPMDERTRQTARAVCQAIMIGLYTPDSSGLPCHRNAKIQEQLRDLRPNDLPESHWRQSWLAFASDNTDREFLDQLVCQADQVFGPARFLTFRTLVRMGRRGDILKLIPQKGPLSLYDADALLETGALHCLESGWTDRIVPDEDNLLSPAVSERWISLLTIEGNLATTGSVGPMETQLESIVSEVAHEGAGTIEQAFNDYILTRASAALARFRIGNRQDAAQVLNTPAGERLPVWERAYLNGLSLLALGYPDDARSYLEDAISDNPYQGAVCMALAAIHTDRNPGEGLSLLQSAEPTRELHGSRAALLARCGRYDEAWACLEKSKEKGMQAEPARLFWPAGRRHLERQVRALETALLEQKGQWQQASNVWALNAPPDLPATLIKTRAFFQAVMEKESLLPHQSWRRSVLSQKINRGRYELGQALLNRDSLFFWSAAILPEDPILTVKGFQRLLRQREWVSSQQHSGGSRLIYMGDVLLKNGQAPDAIRAYELAEKANHPAAALRREVAEAIHGAHSAPNPDQSPEHRKTLSGYYPSLLYAMAKIADGQMDAARSSLREAESREAPEAVCRVLRQLSEKAVDQASLSESEILEMKLPPDIEMVLRLIAGPGTWQERLKSFALDKDTQWIEEFPITKPAALGMLLNFFCRKGDWESMLQTCGTLMSSKDPALLKAATLAQVRYALHRILETDIEGALETLMQLGK